MRVNCPTGYGSDSSNLCDPLTLGNWEAEIAQLGELKFRGRRPMALAGLAEKGQGRCSAQAEY